MDNTANFTVASKGMNVRIPQTPKRALRLFAIFFSGTGLGNLITFLALPVYTRLVSPAEYGYFDLTQTYVIIVAALLYADVWVGVMRFSLADVADSAKAIRAGFHFFSLSSLLMVLVALVIWLVSAPEYLGWMLGVGITRSQASFWSFSSRGLGGERAFAASGVINAAISFGTTISLIQFGHLGVAGLYGGVIAGCMAQVVYLEARFHLINSAWHAQPDRVLRARLRSFALPLSLNSVAFWVFTGFGRIVVSSELGLEQNGVFAAASKLAGIVTVIANVITLVWQQVAFEKGPGDPKFFERGNAISASVYSLGCTVSIPLGVFLYQFLVDERYADGWRAVPLFLVVAAMAGYSTFVGNIFYVTERTSSLFWSATACMVVVVLTTVPLVRLLGLNGANVALILGYIINIVVKHLFLRHYDAIRAPLTNLLVGATVSAMAVAATLFLPLTWAAVIVATVAITFGMWLWFTGSCSQLRS